MRPVALHIMWMKHASFLVAILLFLLVGCQTLSNPDSLSTIADHAAYDATSLVLPGSPQYLPAFQKAHDQLAWLEKQPSFSVGTVLDILHQLPVKQFQTPGAILAFDGIDLILELTGYNPSVGADAHANLVAVVHGLRLGLERAGINPAGESPVLASRAARGAPAKFLILRK